MAANYREASRARSDAEFVSKIDPCSQEADESLLWIELLIEDCDQNTETLQWLQRESNELIAIFTSMSRRVKGRQKTA